MGKWIVILNLLTGDVEAMHAVGTFTTQDSCMRWVSMYAMAVPRQGDWFGMCLTGEEFSRVHPGMRVEEGS